MKQTTELPANRLYKSRMLAMLYQDKKELLLSLIHICCPDATEKCAQEAPEYRDVGNEHFVACHYV